MSKAHICYGWDGVGDGVRGAAAFWAWNWGAGLTLMNNFFNGFVYTRPEDTSIHEQQGFGDSLMELV